MYYRDMDVMFPSRLKVVLWYGALVLAWLIYYYDMMMESRILGYRSEDREYIHVQEEIELAITLAGSVDMGELLALGIRL